MSTFLPFQARAKKFFGINFPAYTTSRSTVDFQEANQVDFYGISQDLMADTTITYKMKRQAVVVSIKAKHNYLKIARILQVTTSFVCKVRKELN
ncbi:hypothetical protein ACTXT7_009465 [Hymenolepis weldensis]